MYITHTIFDDINVDIKSFFNQFQIESISTWMASHWNLNKWLKMSGKEIAYFFVIFAITSILVLSETTEDLEETTTEFDGKTCNSKIF